MFTSKLMLTSAAAIALPVLIGVTPLSAAPITFSAAGANPAGIQASVDAFRTGLGTLNANVPGSFGSGRREINWDGVPDGFAAPNNQPANFFNVNSPRGVVLSTPGTGFQVSANSSNPTGTPILFGNIDPALPASFQTFSPQRLFTAVGSNVVDVSFFVPGSTTAALTRGFGSVFTDVDLADTTSMTFFDGANASLGTYFALPGTTPDQSLSFLGVDFGSAVISRVRITSGNTPVGPNTSPGLDVVVMDDFIYGEPVAAAADIPEPSAMAILLMGMASLCLVTFRQRGSA